MIIATIEPEGESVLTLLIVCQWTLSHAGTVMSTVNAELTAPIRLNPSTFSDSVCEIGWKSTG